MITCPQCDSQLEDDSLYCEECGISLRENVSNAENEEKLQGLNNQLNESRDKNYLEIDKLKKELIEKDDIVSTYSNQTYADKISIEKIKKQRNTAIGLGITALVISIIAAVSYYNDAIDRMNSYYDQTMSLEEENNTLKGQIKSIEDRSKDLTLITNERNNLQSQVDSLTNRNKSLQTEIDELKMVALDVSVSDISIANTDNSDNLIDNYGATLYANRLRFLTPRITYNSRIEGSITFYLKVIEPSGRLKTGTSSPAGYSYTWKTNVRKGNNNAVLGGWGNDSGGSYNPGTYTVEVWYNNMCLKSTSVTIR